MFFLLFNYLYTPNLQYQKQIKYSVAFQIQLFSMSHNQQTNIEPHIVNRFNVIKKIGSGAYGHVWKVQDKISKKIFALKKIFDAFQHSTDAQRTYREIQILKQIDHPNIIKLYQTVKAQNNRDVYLIFEFMEADLHNVIAQGILREVHIRFIIYQLAKALKYLHSGLIIHRDLKPSNILINSNCVIKLCDFGLVRSILPQDQNATALTEGVATRWYRAPQILLGSTKYSTPADIWSFGCIIYQIVAQKPMFPGENTTDQLNKVISYCGFPTQQQLKDLKSDSARTLLKQIKIPYYTSNLNSSKKQMLKDFPPVLAQLILKMTAFNPEQRMTIQELLNHEAVQAFKKKQQQIDSKKIIITQVNDNKKLSVDQYRNLVYGGKRANSLDGVGCSKPSTKKLLTHYNSNISIENRFSNQMHKQAEKQRQRQKQDKNTVQERHKQQKAKQIQKFLPKYVKLKQFYKSPTYNKSMQFGSTSNLNSYNKTCSNHSIETSIKNIQEKTAQSRNVINTNASTTSINTNNNTSSHYTNQLLKDPSRLSYISKTFYSPKYTELNKVGSNLSTNFGNYSQSYGHNTSQTLNNANQKSGYLNNNTFNYASSANINSSSSNNTNSGKVGTSYTASSAYTHNRRPMLFKSSKYVTTVNGNRNEENYKE